MTSTHHIQLMKLVTVFAASLVASSTMIAAPASANNCFGLTGMDATQCRSQQRSQTSKARSAAIASSCPAGTRYHKIKTGGLIFKRTVAEGCFTDYEAANLKVNADSAHRAHVQRVIRNANQNRMRQCFGSANVYGNTVYGNSTCF